MARSPQIFLLFEERSLIVNNILIVGSSIAIVFNASGFSESAIVSPISKPSTPIIAQISPAITS
jgi:hypothetical protein